tara:strand:- start:579 stop:2579 length:2001 start_codon:yes stop_codon:yes gene_type:complete
VKFKKILFLVFYLSLSLLSFLNASELGGIKILQSSDNFINYDDNINRERNYDKNVKIYLNNSFNLSFKADERYANQDSKKKRWNDFIIPKPDYFFDLYVVYEKDSFIVNITSSKTLVQDLPQSSLKVRECESLREQLIREKLDFNIKDNKYSKQFLRRAKNNQFNFKDRIIFKYSSDNKDIVHLFTCSYNIVYNNSDEQHFLTTRLIEGVLLNDEFIKMEKFSNYKNIEKFNSNYIKNFKIWGNIDEINYDNGEIFSLSSYRSESFTKHQIEAEKKEIEKIKKDKIAIFKKEIFKLNKEINKKKEKLSKEIDLLNKPLLRLEDDLKKEINKENKLIIRIEEQKKNFQSNFISNYGNCFPGSISKFVSPLESVYAKLELTNKSDFINYSINYIKFNNNDKSLFFFDFVKEKVKCKTSLSIFDEYDVLDLNNIKLRFFNKVNSFNLEIPEINLKINNKLKKINKKVITLNKEIKEYNKNLSYELDQLTKKFNSEIASIENQIKVIDEKILKLDENYKPILSTSKLVDLDNIPKLLDKAKEDTVEEIKKNNDITQDQDKSVVTSGLTLSEKDALKAQIYGCWSIPLGLPYNENLLVRIKIELKPDGSITKTEILDHARMNKPGQGSYKVLAESALRAVKLCQPLRVPSTGYERWKTITINFDAREMLGG